MAQEKPKVAVYRIGLAILLNSELNGFIDIPPEDAAQLAVLIGRCVGEWLESDMDVDTFLFAIGVPDDKT